jgi:amino acid transporter
MAAAISIGIGGMVGAGIFSILGVVAHVAGNAMWLSFAVGGVVAMLSTYSYAKLGATFPSAGGAVHFLVKSFGDGVLAGGMNLFMWAGYIISLALYATAFGHYAATFVTTQPSLVFVRSLAVSAVLLLTLVNAFGAKLMGRSETVIVAIKVAILLVFAAAGVWFIKPGQLAPDLWPPAESILFGAGVLFIGYEGFGLVTNATGDMADPKRMLPRSLYISVVLVIMIYLAVAVTVTGNLTNAQIEAAKDYALAEAARPFLGELGFRLVAIAALFSTASAINATLFGSANVCYMIAKDGELPIELSRSEWKQLTGGLALTAALVIGVTLAFDLSGIAMMGSAAFLLVYAVVNAGHLRVRHQTGANAIMIWLSLLTCLAMFAALAVYIYREQPRALAALVIIAACSFVAEAIYRRATGRTIRLERT